MVKYYWLTVAVLLMAACKPTAQKQPQLTVTDIDYLRKNTYIPLERKEAHAFINKFILPWMDSSFNHRKLFIHPMAINPPDTPSLKATKYTTIGGVTIAPPPPNRADTNTKWDGQLLNEVKIVEDADVENFKSTGGNDATYSERWKKKFGWGYWVVSYPAYNQFTNRLIIEAYSEDDTHCGTGREWTLTYTKVDNHWQFKSACSN
ncbi:MAG: hypothetical protein ABIN91_13060 [Mucilaginibacter sp.]|uniref:hypothetical protein n=1 Tax=Mucilaginibacter sp. TaxID=1882438 RepID=UPI003267E90A